MPDIKITYAVVRDTAAKMRSDNEKLSQLLSNIQKAINGLEADYTSDASDTIRAKITGMQPKFDSYKEVIESYAKFLDRTADEWEQTGNILNDNASQFI